MLGSPTDGASKPEAQQYLTVPLGATQTKSEQRKIVKMLRTSEFTLKDPKN